MTPCGEAKQYYWPEKQDTCWTERGNILCKVQAPSIMSSSVKGYSFADSDIRHIANLFKNI